MYVCVCVSAQKLLSSRVTRFRNAWFLLIILYSVNIQKRIVVKKNSTYIVKSSSTSIIFIIHLLFYQTTVNIMYVCVCLSIVIHYYSGCTNNRIMHTQTHIYTDILLIIAFFLDKEFRFIHSFIFVFINSESQKKKQKTENGKNSGKKISSLEFDNHDDDDEILCYYWKD